MKIWIASLFVIAMSINATSAHAVYTPEPAPAPSSQPAPAAPTPEPQRAETRSVNNELSRISSLVYSENFRAARAELRTLNREFPNNADVNNLLGFTSRKLNLNAASAKFYKTALRIEPNHLDALAYQGELFIATKKMARAKRNLAKLERLCGVDCSQFKDLKEAIQSR
jgi:predicted Zn-dependent protease